MSLFTREHDVLIIAAGFASLYQLHRPQQAGFDTHVVEVEDDDVGGT